MKVQRAAKATRPKDPDAGPRHADERSLCPSARDFPTRRRLLKVPASADARRLLDVETLTGEQGTLLARMSLDSLTEAWFCGGGPLICRIHREVLRRQKSMVQPFCEDCRSAPEKTVEQVEAFVRELGPLAFPVLKCKNGRPRK